MAKEPAVYRKFTLTELLVCMRLLNVIAIPGSSKKRWLRQLPDIMRKTEITDKQMNYYLHLFYHFRAQIRDYKVVYDKLPENQQKMCVKDYKPAK